MDKQKIFFYIVKRLVLSIITIFIITTIVFFLSQIIPGGPFEGVKNLTYELRQIKGKIYGLDKPIYVQYLLYLKNISMLDLGTSISQQGITVTEIIYNSMKYSLYTGTASALIAIIFGIIIGCLAAFFNKKIFDKITMFLTVLTMSLPLFFISCLCNKTLSGFFSSSGVSRFILPTIVLSIPPLCSIIRLTKSSVIDVLNTNYIKAIRARGISEKNILFKHALPNAIVPVISYIGPTFADIITGNVIIEHAFGIPGVGQSYINFISHRDYPVVMGMTIFFTFIIVGAILISDIICAIINPNIDFN